MEKKSQPLIFVGYCEDMKAYRLFDPISKDVLFQRAIHFDECFNPTSSPTPSTNCHADDGVDHADNFVFVEQEDDEHVVAKITLLKMKIKPEENIPSTPIEHEQPEQEQLDQEQHLRRIFHERKRPDRYGYEPTLFQLFFLNPLHTQSQTIGVSFFSHDHFR
jgi:hypothetical protein